MYLFGNLEQKGHCHTSLITCQLQKIHKLFLLWSQLLSADLTWILGGFQQSPSIYCGQATVGTKKEFSSRDGKFGQPFIGYGVEWVISPRLGSFPHRLQKGTGLMEEAGSSVLASCGCSMIGHPWKILVSLLLRVPSAHPSQTFMSLRLSHPLKWVWQMNLPSHSSEGSLRDSRPHL